MINKDELNDSNNRTKITLIDINKSTSKSFQINTKIKCAIKNNEDLFTKEVKKYKIIVDETTANSKKSFKIECDDEHIVVREKIKNLFEKLIVDENKNNIIFSNEKKRNYSHRVIVSNNENKSLCFSINLPNFSSGEVCEMMINKIGGE